MFYFVAYEYWPNTAVSNRLISYIKALSELGIDTHVMFFMPNRQHEKVDKEFPHIYISYLWEHHYINIPRLNRLSLRYYIHHFVQNLKPNDKVYIYGFPDLVVALQNRNDIQIYIETTEHPDVCFNPFLKGTNIKKYLDACSKSSGLIVISSQLKDYFVKNNCNPEKTHVVNMTVDGSRFDGISKQITEKYIAYCGTASNNKDGVDQLIKSFSLVVKKHPEYKLYIIGNTPSKRQRFGNYELVKTLGIENNVVFTGSVSANEMPQLLTNAEILALDRPDNMQAKYGFPTKLGEYLLTGNPVVITRVGDIPLFLSDGVNAFIAEPDNPQSFAEKLCFAIENPVEARKIGERGKQVAETCFNSIKETKKLISIINR